MFLQCNIPAKLIREFALFLALPLSVLINQYFESGTFPRSWKKAHIRAIPKVNPPESCDDLRPISLTPCLAKVTESFILRQLLEQVRQTIDKYQYGGLPKCGTSIYLVRMYNQILKWLEKQSCFDDLAAIDFRKAFDLLSNLVACQNLKRMGAKRQTLAIVLDFLSERQQKVFALYEEDCDSEWSKITCGAPQGTKLAGITFLAIINYLMVEHTDKYKFVDDLSLLFPYRLHGNVPTKQFPEITFDLLRSQCSDMKMTINFVKSKILRLNPLKRDFVPPEVPFSDVSEVKVLSVILSHDCTFTTHINSVTRKVNASLQTLSKMRRFGCNAHSLLRAYLYYVRSILEYACPVWGPSVLRTTYIMQELESVQKRVTRIILSNIDISYHDALATLELQSLELRLGELILRFGKMLLSNPPHRDILPPEALTVSLTRHKLKLSVVGISSRQV